jgi:hypothetical protein
LKITHEVSGYQPELDSGKDKAETPKGIFTQRRQAREEKPGAFAPDYFARS